MSTRDSAFGLRASVRLALLVAAAVAVATCGSNSTPTSPTTTTGPKSETWSGVLAPGGASSRSFTADAAGTISITMTSVGATVGLGVGLPRLTGGGCRLGVQVITGASTTPQITTAADAGQYCVQVFDTGTLTDPVPYAIKIDHP